MSKAIITAKELGKMMQRSGVSMPMIIAGGPDQIREYLISWASRYSFNGSSPKPRVREGIEFWRVGCNASHEFYAGVDATGRLFRYSLDCDIPDEECPPQNEGESEEEYIFRSLGGQIKEVMDFDGYYGHF